MDLDPDALYKALLDIDDASSVDTDETCKLNIFVDVSVHISSIIALKYYKWPRDWAVSFNF